MSCLAGKKLLILGANPETIPLIEAANQMGVYTIVTDYTPGAPAKKFAAKSYDVDGTDVDALVVLGKELSVDGVLVGVADRLIVSYQQVCERLGLPCYGTREQCEILTDKVRFAQECKKYGIRGIPSYSLDAELNSEEVAQIKYPVLVKPADSNSGKGIRICYQKDELKSAIDGAMACSKSKRFLVERYMTCDDIFIYYTFVNGICLPAVIADRFTCRGRSEGKAVCLGAVSPSKYIDLYYQKLHPLMCSMFQDLGMKNGVLMLSAFVENEDFYVYDPGFRLQGEAPNLTVKEMTGFDHLEMLIWFALTGQNPYAERIRLMSCKEWNRLAATIWYLVRKGVIKKIEGLSNINSDPTIFKVVSRFDEGDIITEDMLGTEQQVLARVYLTGNTLEELKNNICRLQQALKVEDIDGNNMLIPGFETDCIYK